jgi:serine/alanine adding enzyme
MYSEKSFLPISEVKAVQQWHDFVCSIKDTVPFSFSPDLYIFYNLHFNWTCIYIILRKGGVIFGVLPVVNTGNAWVSLPHYSYGGLLIKNTEDFQLKGDLLDRLIQKLEIEQTKGGFYYYDVERDIELSINKQIFFFFRSLNFYGSDKFNSSIKVTSIYKIPPTYNELNSSLSSNLRRKIKRAEGHGLTVKYGKEELINDFYEVYSNNIHELNSLNYKKSFFEDILISSNYSNPIFFVAYFNGIAVGSSLLISYMGFHENAFFATLKKYRRMYISDFLHWKMISYSISKGTSDLSNAVYSFGRSSKNSSVHNYKRHWPVTDLQIYCYDNLNKRGYTNFLLPIWKLLPSLVKRKLGGKLITHYY